MVAFSALLAAGVRPPAEWAGGGPMAKAATATIWASALADLDDQRLSMAIAMWMARADAPWWPMPAAIRAHAPPAPTSGMLTGPVETSVYNDELDDFGRQQVLDQADREGWWSLPPAECWRRMGTAAVAQLEGTPG